MIEQEDIEKLQKWLGCDSTVKSEQLYSLTLMAQQCHHLSNTIQREINIELSAALIEYESCAKIVEKSTPQQPRKTYHVEWKT